MSNSLLDSIINRLDRGVSPDSRWPDHNGEYWSLCPFHADEKTGSFSVSKKGFNCFSCGKSGSLAELAEKLRIEHPRSDLQDKRGLTLEAYAAAKHLQPEFLRDLGVTDRAQNGERVLKIPYRNQIGEEVATHCRVGLDGHKRFWWTKGSRIVPYGVWKLPELLQCCTVVEGELPYIFLVEGESDAQTLWRYGIPALGIPGATTWMEEWKDYISGSKLFIWQKPGQSGEQFVAHIGNSLPDIWIVKPPSDRKDISECHIAGDDLPTLLVTLMREATSYRSIIEKNESAGNAKSFVKATTLLLGDILSELEVVLQQLGLVGEVRNAKLLYLAMTSRLLDMPISVVVKGPSSGGKSYTVGIVLKLFPDTAFHALTAMSDRALIYWTEPMTHRMLVINEAAGINSVITSYIIRSLLSDGRIRYTTVESTENGLVPRLIEREGPTGLITTTTVISLHPENETRMLSILIRDDSQQTGQILEGLAKKFTGGSADLPDLSRWHAMQNWLEWAAGREVVIPYASYLAHNTSTRAVRMRRDFEKLLCLLQVIAILYQCQREKDEHGRIIATAEDYAIVYDLVYDTLNEASEASVPPTVRGIVRAAEKLLAGKLENVSVSYHQLEEVLHLDNSAVSRRVKSAINLGYLENLEDKKGKPARIILGEKMPDDVAVLPHPDEIKKYLDLPPDISATVQHPTKSTVVIDLQDEVDKYLDAPYEVDTDRPCPVCHQLAWRERPDEAGGGYYCSCCHP